jgi:hypothetical protein
MKFQYRRYGYYCERLPNIYPDRKPTGAEIIALMLSGLFLVLLHYYLTLVIKLSLIPVSPVHQVRFTGGLAGTNSLIL